jgi:hypothetical protein
LTCFCIQIHPHRSPQLDLASLRLQCEQMAGDDALVQRFSWHNGFDDHAYVDLTFEQISPSDYGSSWINSCIKQARSAGSCKPLQSRRVKVGTVGKTTCCFTISTMARGVTTFPKDCEAETADVRVESKPEVPRASTPRRTAGHDTCGAVVTRHAVAKAIHADARARPLRSTSALELFHLLLKYRKSGGAWSFLIGIKLPSALTA